MIATQKKDGSESSSYDILPYDSACCKAVHPDSVYSRLHTSGFDTPGYKTCRVLELGCGLGGNLLPYAIAFQESECTGIDLSKRQIESAKNMADALGIKNIEFKHADILGMDSSYGQFDYIICHGVFSWVPHPVRLKIMALCRTLLARNGAAVISYNALPGWHLDNALRDAMRFHMQNDKGAAAVEKARKFTHFLAKNSHSGTPSRAAYKEFLTEEAQILSGLSDSYIYHDQLASENTPFYLKDFAVLAKEHGLQYVCDAMENEVRLNEEAEIFLSAIEDIVEREQYRDFLTNCRFHISIVTHKEHKKTTAIKQGTSNTAENPREVKLSGKPCAWPLARQQVIQNRERPMLTSMNRESIKTSLFMNLIVLYADSTKTIEQLAEDLKAHTHNGDIRLKDAGGKAIPENRLKKVLCEVIAKKIALMAENGLILP